MKNNARYVRRHIARAIRRGQQLVHGQSTGSWFRKDTDCACLGGMAILGLAEEQGLDPVTLKHRGVEGFLTFRDQLDTTYQQVINSLINLNDNLQFTPDQAIEHLTA